MSGCIDVHFLHLCLNMSLVLKTFAVASIGNAVLGLYPTTSSNLYNTLTCCNNHAVATFPQSISL